MQPQRNSRPLLDEHEIDRAVLDLLLNEQGAGPWATEELAREIGDPLTVEDALTRLHGSGLIHRIDVYAFPSRAAIRAVQLTS